MELLNLLESSGLATHMRLSTWSYPLFNAGHLLGVCLLIGSILPMDLRLMGCWRSIPLLQLWRVLIPVAASGLGLAVLCGFPLFIARASDYAASPLFWGKMILLLSALFNIVIVRAILPRPGSSFWLSHETPPTGARICATLSIVFWLGTLLAGRLIGYF
ncbi:hypothetical protein [Marinobacterium lutimaris]|uniref:DUF2214 domain-containing protein n=1 Tax=Marinobacterium lutimaris TaxID=568106 RepID=A0A1H5TP37_9GAMM|nr:hypothetical protein [Marinobacterium lutimaris]SEF64540.1 hypothetical protein SAMN05444390_101131 [Marinobacterium lutimaris]